MPIYIYIYIYIRSTPYLKEVTINKIEAFEYIHEIGKYRYVGCLNTHLLPNSMFVKSDVSNKTHKRKIPQTLRTGLLKVTIGFVFMYNIMFFSFICHYNLFGDMLGMTIDTRSKNG